MSGHWTRFLALQPRSLTRAALGERAADFFETETPIAYGQAWRALTAEAGLRCPEELARLADEMAEQFVCFLFRGHPYSMLTPDAAREQRRALAELASSWPALKPFTTMVPVFGEDGDYLLLDATGALWALPHDDLPPLAPATTSLEALFEEAEPARVNL